MNTHGEAGNATGLSATWNGETCSVCGSENLMTIEIALDEPLAVEICSDCEARIWLKDGEPVPAEALFGAGGRETIPRQKQNRRHS